MKYVVIICTLFFSGFNTSHGAQGGFGPGTTVDPNTKQGLTGMVVQPQTARINNKLKVTLYSFLPPGEKCEVIYSYPGLQYPVKLLVGQSPYTVPAQYQPVFSKAGEYTIHAYTGTTGEYPCPYGKHLKTKVTIEDMTRFKQPPVVTKPPRLNTPGPINPQAPARQAPPQTNNAVRSAPTAGDNSGQKGTLGRYPTHMHISQ
jgi:hypothetical protein